MDISKQLINASRTLSKALGALSFGYPVTHIYNPLDYAQAPYELYLSTYATTPKRVLFLGMNPGPWGMAQTGIPFGEVSHVKNWMQITAPVSQPAHMHAKRPIEGFACKRSEVSGRRLWGLFSTRYPNPEDFFKYHFVLNYCPLIFLQATGSNLTPDKLPLSERLALYQVCDNYLAQYIRILQPDWLIGIGNFARLRIQEVLKQLPNSSSKVATVLHPSPANPHAHKDWAGVVSQRLMDLNIWTI